MLNYDHSAKSAVIRKNYLNKNELSPLKFEKGIDFRAFFINEK